jgi:uncharacterized repeat protein (TIGR02543 family)
VTINYKAGTGGRVPRDRESLTPSTGLAKGSTATANSGYSFVNWTNAQGAVVGTNATFTPQKVNGLNVAATYTANFAQNSVITISSVKVKNFNKNLQNSNNSNLKFTVEITLSDGTVAKVDHSEKVKGSQKGNSTFTYSYLDYGTYKIYAAWNGKNTVTTVEVRNT